MGLRSERGEEGVWSSVRCTVRVCMGRRSGGEGDCVPRVCGGGGGCAGGGVPLGAVPALSWSLLGNTRSEEKNTILYSDLASKWNTISY